MATKRKNERSFDATRKYNEYMRNYRRKKREQAGRLDLPIESKVASHEALATLKDALKGGESE